MNKESEVNVEKKVNGKFHAGDYEDLEIIKKVKSGQVNEFKRIYDKYHDFIFYYCFQSTRDQQMSKDLTIEIMTKVFVSIDKYEVNYTFNSWVWRIVKNYVIDYVRNREINPININLNVAIMNHDYSEESTNIITPSQLASDINNPEQECYSKELIDRRSELVQSLLSKMSDRDRKLVTMYYFENKSYEEIAEALDLKLNSMRVYLKRAKETLRDEIGSYNLISDLVTV